jgi:uncharacterized damage-inducible protein DinB
MTDYFKHLFKYDNWATNETIASVLSTKVKIERAEKLLSHIVAAQKVWTNRILRKDEAGDAWQFFPIEESIKQLKQTNMEWMNILDGLKDENLEKRIEYKNTKGEVFVNNMKDILMHVINHSTYHRAQIAQLIRQNGGEPAKTDYIVYQRQINQ